MPRDAGRCRRPLGYAVQAARRAACRLPDIPRAIFLPAKTPVTPVTPVTPLTPVTPHDRSLHTQFEATVKAFQ